MRAVRLCGVLRPSALNLGDESTQRAESLLIRQWLGQSLRMCAIRPFAVSLVPIAIRITRPGKRRADGFGRSRQRLPSGTVRW